MMYSLIHKEIGQSSATCRYLDQILADDEKKKKMPVLQPQFQKKNTN